MMCLTLAPLAYIPGVFEEASKRRPGLGEGAERDWCTYISATWMEGAYPHRRLVCAF